MSANSASSAPASNSLNTSTQIHQNVNPSEVGWQFVPQYYSFVNKQPNRLHCFYNKRSTFIHGTEGEDGRPCHGQHEIHQKILSIGFQDCKVYIHSMDAQASADSGIIIQVIGEMSNRNEPWRKFVQTFFLAEQPNGYFVLNDIFRFLKEEFVEDDEAALQAEELEPEVAPAVPTHVEPEPPVLDIPTPEPLLATEPVREPTPEPVPAPVPVEETAKPQPNGLHHEPEKEEETAAAPPVPQEPVREPTPTPAPAPVPAPTVIQKSPSPAPAAPAAPAVQPTPVPTAPQPQQPEQAPQQPPAPPAPKTWANLAAADSKKWGSAVAQESRGRSVVAAQPAPQAPPRSGTSTPVSASGGPRSGTGQKNGRVNHQYYQQAMTVTSPHVFVKGVVDPMKNEQVERLLEERGGKIKEIEIVRHSACAFVEYEDVKSAQRAIIASLNTGHGGDGGVFYTTESGENLRLYVETKKERGERPPPRGRGGAPPQGNRGNFRGRGRGRGTAPTAPAKA